MRTLSNSLVLALMLAGCTNGNKDTTDGDTTPDNDTWESGEVIEFDSDSSFGDANDLRGVVLNEIDVDQPALNYGLIGEGIISPAEDRDFYVITFDEGVTYSIGTLAYALTGQVVLDTVVRIYDGNENLLVTNDDMPFRFQETDSAVVFTAPATGEYYIEVLDFGDWWINDMGEDDFGGQVAPDGGRDFEYQLIAAIMPNNEADPNNALGDVLIGLSGGSDTDGDTDTDVEPPDTGFSDLTSEYYLPSLFAGYSEDFVGTFSEDGDVDYWPVLIQLTEATTVDYAYIALSGWPGYAEGTRISLVDADGNVLATSTDLIANGDYDLWFDDVGLISKVDIDEVYYIKAENDEGMGAGDTYPTMKFIYLPTLGEPETSLRNSEDAGPGDGNNSRDLPGSIPIEVSANDPTVFTSSIWGELPPDDTDGDWYHLSGSSTNGLDGKYVQAWFKAAEVGSQLDAKITLYDSTGAVLEEFTTDAEFDDSIDPNVRDFLAEGEDVFIHIDAESRGDDPHAQQYIVAIIVTDGPVF